MRSSALLPPRSRTPMTIHDDPRRAAARDDDLDAFRQLGDETLNLLSLHVEHARAAEGRVISQRPVTELARTLELDRWIRAGGMDAAAWGRWLEQFLSETTKLHHPHFLGHQVSAPHYPSSIADLVHGTLN